MGVLLKAFRSPFSRRDPEHNVIKEIEMIIQLPRMVGLCPYFFNQGVCQVSTNRLLLTLLQITVAFIVDFIYLKKYFFQSKETFFSSCVIAVEIFSFAISPLFLLFFPRKLDQLNRSIKCMQQVDLKINRLRLNTCRKPLYRFNKIRIVHWIFYSMTIILKILSNPIENILWSIFVGWPGFMTSVSLDMITSILGVLQTRVSALIILTTDMMALSHSGKLEELIRFQNQLCTAGCLLNKVFALSFLQLCTGSFFDVVSELYYTYFNSVQGLYDTITIFRKLCWVVIGILTFWRTVSSCADVSYKVKEFNRIVYQFALSDKSHEISTNSKVRLHISMKRDIVFKAYGFFTLDYTLIYPAIAAAVTYLVILIQFDEDLKNPV